MITLTVNQRYQHGSNGPGIFDDDNIHPIVRPPEAGFIQSARLAEHTINWVYPTANIHFRELLRIISNRVTFCKRYKILSIQMKHMS